jgi:hypothetical protein
MTNRELRKFAEYSHNRYPRYLRYEIVVAAQQSADRHREACHWLEMSEICDPEFATQRLMAACDNQGRGAWWSARAMRMRTELATIERNDRRANELA